MRRMVWAWALASLLNGCGGGGADYTPPPADLGQMELWKLELMLADRAANNAVESWGPSSFSEVFAPDGSVIRPGVGEIRGREAIHDAFIAQITGNTLAGLVWTPDRAEVSRAGNMGYTVGPYLATLVDSAGTRSPAPGMYVRFWVRQADSTWKVDLEIRNPVALPDTAAETAPGESPGDRGS